jgi:hypothetical protein
MSRTLMLASLALALGCSAQLRDGVYGCVDGHCPSGYACWERDHLCHTTPEPENDAGTDANVETPDMGMPPPDMGTTGACTGATCSGTTCGMCPGGPPPQTCAQGQWNDPMLMTGPTYSCTTTVMTTHHGEACVMGGSTCTAPDVCLMATGGSFCMRPCMPGSQCGFTEDCVMGIPGAMGGVCARSCGVCPLPSLTCSASLMHCLPAAW